MRTANHWSRWATSRPIWTPAEISPKLWYLTRKHLTISANPTATGTAPPTVTFGGARSDLANVPALYVQIDGVGTLGVATFKLSLDGGLTFPLTGQPTSALYTVTLAPINGLTIAFAAGTYATDNVYQANSSSLIQQGSLVGSPAANTLPKRPIIAWNSSKQAVLRFDGVANLMTVSIASLAQVEQIFAVFKSNSANTGGGAGTYFDGLGGNTMRLYRSGATQLTATTDGATIINTSAVTPQAWHVWETGFNGVSSYIKQDNAQVAAGATGANNGAGITLGCFGGGASGFIDMDFAELVGFSPALSAVNQQLMYQYLSQLARGLA